MLLATQMINDGWGEYRIVVQVSEYNFIDAQNE